MIGLHRAATRLATFSALVLFLFCASSFFAQALATASRTSALALAPAHAEAAGPHSRQCDLSFLDSLWRPAASQHAAWCPGTGTLKERRISAPEFTVRDWNPDAAPPPAWAAGRIRLPADEAPAVRRTAAWARWELPWSRSPPDAAGA